MCARGALGWVSGVVSGLERAAQHQVGKQGPLQMRVLLLDGAHPLRLFAVSSVNSASPHLSLDGVHPPHLALRVLDPEPRRRRRSVLAKAAAPRERADVALARQPAVAPRGGGAVPLPQPHLR